jgi:hypothetical protein
MGVLLQAGKAFLAAATAASRSVETDIGTADKSIPSKGEITSIAFSEEAFTNPPLIKFCTGWYFILNI